MRLTSLSPRLMVWLEQRHLEQTFSAVNANLVEQELAQRGWIPPPPSIHRRSSLIDVSGFTELTEERGDYAAPEVGELLHEGVDEVRRRKRGELIKLLGDGAKLQFPDATSAVDAKLEVVKPHDGSPRY